MKPETLQQAISKAIKRGEPVMYIITDGKSYRAADQLTVDLNTDSKWTEAGTVIEGKFDAK